MAVMNRDIINFLQGNVIAEFFMTNIGFNNGYKKPELLLSLIHI